MPRLNRPAATQYERKGLARTYQLGGLTPDEARATFDDVADLMDRGFLHVTYTGMGELIVLTSLGLRAIPDDDLTPRSLSRSVDLAYERLCLAQLDWRVLAPGIRTGAERFGGLRRFPRVQTDQRDAYVVAQLSRGGTTSESIHRLAQRFRSTLAATQHDLVILSPSAVRGRQAAEQHRANLRFVHCLPQTEPGQPGQRVWTGEEVGDLWEVPPIQGPAITELQAAELKGAGVPDLTLEILQLVRKDRIERAHEALACDGVMTEGQLKRHFKLEAEDLPAVPFVQDLARPVHMRPNLEVPVRFLLATRTMGQAEVPHLAHRAGAGELRHQYGVPPSACEVVRPSRGTVRRRAEEPDAIWQRADGGRVAVEFDTGSYVRRVVEEKRDSFRQHFQGLVWGVVSERRQATVSSWLTQRVDLAQWWR
ncbi:hypothetical protein [Deinococcus multiflagellatus]|uniref:Uncharacterized protein n=1 Tax=Deinococcus multiflagellatus TaxID=1656887 RepID=A0ABW1ZSZ9_9DEIO|nr:hypothetical protein [Deinococcus multiflagellatus]MBZ9715765.1 hypothetical protein [Deinococcus multiflagellatus]